jgi:hypothetical protein
VTNQRPRIVFLIPIASPRVVKDWQLACAYFKQTLSSIFNSTGGNYCVVVAGHELPDFQLPQDPRLKFLSLDHPLPSQEDGYYLAAVRDKMIKLGAAWNYAKSTWNPQYVMKVDWDDLVSSRLVDWLNTAEDEAGYYIKSGYVWNCGSRYLIQITETFGLVCGTCLIIRSDVADCVGPFWNATNGATVDENTRQIERTDNRSLIPGPGSGTILLNDDHGRAEAQFSYIGYKLGIVPFRAAVYRVQNRASVSQRGFKIPTMRFLLGHIRRTRLINDKLRREFRLG